MKRIDYKFAYIIRNNNGVIREAAIRFFEGSYKNKSIYNHETGQIETVFKYDREKRLYAENLFGFKGKFTKDKKGNPINVYTREDFGEIKTDDELRAVINTEMQEDTTREAVDMQKETDVEKLKLIKDK